MKRNWDRQNRPMSDPSGRTMWLRQGHTADATKRFLQTETGGAAVLLVAALVALVWANIDAALVRVVSGRPSCRSPSATRAWP